MKASIILKSPVKIAIVSLVRRTISTLGFGLFLGSLVLAQAEPAKTLFNVRDFGATGNGTNLDSPAINHAIDAAVAAGGGTVIFPAGTYLSGSIHLHSNIHLLVDAGA